MLAIFTRSKAMEKKVHSHQQRMSKAHPEVLDVDGAAKVLGVSRWLVLRLARQGEIPGRKIGREWRFRLTNLLRWLGQDGSKENGDGLEELIRSGRVQLLPPKKSR